MHFIYFPYNELGRPIITITFVDLPAPNTFEALIDTGADSSMIPYSVYSLLEERKLNQIKGQMRKCEGICGKECMDLGDLESKVSVELIRKKVHLDFQVFPPNLTRTPIILGRKWLLDFFEIRFAKSGFQISAVDE
jgi:hypothetical protein